MVDIHAEQLGDIGGGGHRPVAGDQDVGGGADLVAKVLDGAWHVDTPAVIAEVTTQLAARRDRGERDKRRANVGVEALGRLDDTQQRDLQSVLERLAVWSYARAMAVASPR